MIEYAVFNDEGQGWGRVHATLEEAQAHLAWVMDWRTDMEAKAKHEQATGFADGTNEYTYTWAREKDRTYKIMRREVTSWEEVQQ